MGNSSSRYVKITNGIDAVVRLVPQELSVVQEGQIKEIMLQKTEEVRIYDSTTYLYVEINGDRVMRIMGPDFPEHIHINMAMIMRFISLESEIEHLQKFPCATDANPQQWWYTKRFILPRLYKMLCDYYLHPEEANPEVKGISDTALKYNSIVTLTEKMWWPRTWMDVHALELEL